MNYYKMRFDLFTKISDYEDVFQLSSGDNPIKEISPKNDKISLKFFKHALPQFRSSL